MNNLTPAYYQGIHIVLMVCGKRGDVSLRMYFFF